VHARGYTLKVYDCYRPRRAVQDFATWAQTANSIDMGTGYDCFDTLASTLDKRITGVPRANRLCLRAAMVAAGFTNYSHEWWHYTVDHETYPSTYFDFPVARSSVA
jgi:D-alanyl-D-alanine dipeptidase